MMSTGLTPRPEDTPRTRHRKQLRSRRLAYFETNDTNNRSLNDEQMSMSERSSLKHHVNDRSPNNHITKDTDLSGSIIEQMRADPRILPGDVKCVTVERGREDSRPWTGQVPKANTKRTFLDDLSPEQLRHSDRSLQCTSVKDVYNLSSQLLCNGSSSNHVRGHPNGFQSSYMRQSREPDEVYNNNIRAVSGESNKTSLKTEEYHFKLNSSAPSQSHLPPESAQASLDRKTPKVNNRQADHVDVEEIFISARRDGSSSRIHSPTKQGRDLSTSPSKRSSASDFTLSSTTVEDADDLTNVTDLCLSTHRPSEVSWGSHVPHRAAVHKQYTKPPPGGSVTADPGNTYLYDKSDKSDHTKQDLNQNYTITHEDLDMMADLLGPVNEAGDGLHITNALKKGSFNEQNLRSVLGSERFERLMKNFEDLEPEQTSDVTGVVHEPVTSGSSRHWEVADDEDALSEEEPTEFNNSKNLRGGDIEDDCLKLEMAQNHELINGTDDLDLNTHRPSVDPPSYVSLYPIRPQWQTYSTDYEGPQEQSRSPGPRHYADVSSSPRVQCSYSVGQIYAVAEKLNKTAQQEAELSHKSTPNNQENGVLSDVGSSLMGREIRTLRQVPFGPIPQKGRDLVVKQEDDKTAQVEPDNKQLDSALSVPVINPSAPWSVKNTEPKCPASALGMRAGEPLNTVDKMIGDDARKPAASSKNLDTGITDTEPINMKDTNESLNRYFMSLKDLGQDMTFDPVPDPEIIDSPGRGLKPSVKSFKPKEKARKQQASHKPVSVQAQPPADNAQRESPSDPNNQQSDHMTDEAFEVSSSLATSKLLRPISDYDIEVKQKANAQAAINSVIPIKVGKPDPSKEEDCLDNPGLEAQVSHDLSTKSAKHNTPKTSYVSYFDAPSSQHNNGCRSADPGPPCGSRDDLHSQVTAAVSDMDNVTGITERMEKIGINFDFLKKGAPQNGHQENGGGSNYIVNETIKVKTVNGSHGNAVSKPVLSSIHPEQSTGSPQASAADVSRQAKLKDQIKVCPECASVNRPYMDWCTECGGVMIGTEPVPTKLRKVEQNKVRHFIKEDKQLSARNQHVLDVDRFTPEGPKLTPSVRVSRETNSDVRDSETFEYEQRARPDESLPHFLRTQLSLNLRGSTSTLASVSNVSTNKPSTKTNKKKKKKKQPDMAEDLEFLYSEEETTVQSIPNDLRAELSLNLRDSMDSQQSSQHKQPHKVSYKSATAAQSIQTAKKSPRNAASAEVAECGEAARISPSVSSAAVKPEGSVAAPTPPPLVQQQEVLGGEHGGAQEGAHEGAQGRAQEGAQQGAQEEREEGVSVVDEGYREFLHRLINDSRFQPSKSTSEPSQSSGGHVRPHSAGPSRSVQSKVRQSLEPEAYPRRWQTSSMAWSSSHKAEMTSKPSTLHPLRSKERPSSAHVSKSVSRSSTRHGNVSRPSSAHTRGSLTHAQRVVRQYLDDVIAEPADVREEGTRPVRPTSAGKSRSSSNSKQPRMMRSMDPSLATGNRGVAHRHANRLLTIKSAPCAGSSGSRGAVLQTGAPSGGGISVHRTATALDEMSKYMALADGYTSKLYAKDDIVHPAKRPKSRGYIHGDQLEIMSPRIHGGDLSMLLCLPDELLLYLFSFLSHADLMKCSQVCVQFRRVALDRSLWKKITLKKKLLTDDWLREIGSKQPTSLNLVQCHGDQVSSNGLRELFRQCGDSLMELNFTGCTKGHLTGNRILLHAANRCQNITHLDASWSNIDDNGLMDIASSCDRLESLCLNGCPTITDEAIEAVIIKHGLYLHTLELFGCFNLTQKAAISIMNHCKGLVTLNLGQCWKLTDTCISQLTASLGMVENLDLRGCKQLKDVCIHQIVRNCPHLKTLALANCPGLTDAGLAELATMATYIQSLDLCGCKNITNSGIKTLSMGCQYLEYLDLSSTGVTHKGVSSVASYCTRRLEVVKVNFCKNMTAQSLTKLVKNCNKLKKLYLYGLTCIRSTEDLKQHNPNVWIEM